MPNFCRNYLKITGNKNDLNRLETYFIKDRFEELCLDLQRIESEAGRYLETRFFTYVSLKREHNLLIVDGATAWSPSFEPFIYLISTLPSLVIDYSYLENGVGLMGKVKLISTGKKEWIISESRQLYNYPIDEEALYEFLKAN